jgi:hypothetical protein
MLNGRWCELEQVYRKYPRWKEYRAALKEIFFGYSYLWALNMRLILWIWIFRASKPISPSHMKPEVMIPTNVWLLSSQTMAQ